MTSGGEADITARIAFERTATGLIGDHIVDVRYSDVYNFGPDPDPWDHGDWHHAVMGVELMLGSGPVSIIWTDTFHPLRSVELEAGVRQRRRDHGGVHGGTAESPGPPRQLGLTA